MSMDTSEFLGLGISLLRRVVDKVNALLDVALEVLVAGLEELLLLVVRLADHINGVLSAGGLEKLAK